MGRAAGRTDLVAVKKPGYGASFQSTDRAVAILVSFVEMLPLCVGRISIRMLPMPHDEFVFAQLPISIGVALGESRLGHKRGIFLHSVFHVEIYEPISVTVERTHPPPGIRRGVDPPREEPQPLDMVCSAPKS